MRARKAELEDALAKDVDLVNPTKALDNTNKRFKDEVKHANMHLPKSSAKAKAKAQAASIPAA